MNHTNPDLRVFRSLGGKMIQYHGWGDPAITPLGSIDYYKSVLAAMGSLLDLDPKSALTDTQDFYRLFMAPGMGHCGVPGGYNFDGVAALDQWVTQGKAPDRIIMSHTTNGQVDRTHPLCPYPKVAQWKGSGSVNDAENFVCADPSR
jgi:feruloyl esterase